MMATTYHGKNGKFCKADSAKTVVKGGERFKVVRQHRRVCPKPRPATERKDLPDARWVPISEVLAALGVRFGG